MFTLRVQSRGVNRGSAHYPSPLYLSPNHDPSSSHPAPARMHVKQMEGLGFVQRSILSVSDSTGSPFIYRTSRSVTTLLMEQLYFMPVWYCFMVKQVFKFNYSHFSSRIDCRNYAIMENAGSIFFPFVHRLSFVFFYVEYREPDWQGEKNEIFFFCVPKGFIKLPKQRILIYKPKSRYKYLVNTNINSVLHNVLPITSVVLISDIYIFLFWSS